MAVSKIGFNLARESDRFDSLIMAVTTGEGGNLGCMNVWRTGLQAALVCGSHVRNWTFPRRYPK